MRYPLLVLFLLLAGCSQLSRALAIYTEDWPPLSFRNSQDSAAGMAVEVVQELQKRTGNRNVIQVQPWARAYHHLLSEPDVLLFTVGRNAEREGKMTLLGPVAISSTDVFALREQAQQLRDMGDVRRRLPTAAYRGSIFESTARAHGYNVTATTDPQHSAKMLLAGRVRLWAEGNIVVPQVLQRLGAADNAVERIATLESLALYLAFSKGTSRQLVLAWEQALRDMKRDGSFQAIHKRWFPLSAPPLEVFRVGLEP